MQQTDTAVLTLARQDTNERQDTNRTSIEHQTDLS